MTVKYPDLSRYPYIAVDVEPQGKKEKEIHIYYTLPTDTHSGLISYTGDIPKKAVQKLLKTIHDS